MTYITAMPQIRRYFDLRYFYVETVEYEMGYAIYDIVYRYQMMLEIYQIMYNKYYMQPWRYKTPISYMFYMYRNMLEYGMTIIHLCNMLHETEKKFQGKALGHWDDYPDSNEQEKTKASNFTRDKNKAVSDYEKRREQERKKRLKERKKERKKIDIGFTRTTPQRRPKKSAI
ncbi:uncharacterized protein LOC114359303 [Ostrinia furnacalis]|uniref:uncharacterized protein LOC114359303 n=1 Tax=Ostrinia furnacalis TaxID=93504 RepID=UPI00103CE497|nr:uncharacterized protein LOC114359303 [Ostrinia furnacalis]